MHYMPFKPILPHVLEKELVDCIDSDSIDCHNGIYGEINPLLYHLATNIFVKKSDHDRILDAIGCNIAIDNVNIIILDTITTDTTRIILSGNYGNIMLVDSYITNGYDISYSDQSCNLLKNNRLSLNKQYIVSLLLHCSDITGSGNLIQSLDSSVTLYTNHLSPTQLHLSVDSSCYYP